MFKLSGITEPNQCASNYEENYSNCIEKAIQERDGYNGRRISSISGHVIVSCRISFRIRELICCRLIRK